MGRRSLPSASTSASKSPDSDPAPRQKESSNRPPLTSNNSSGRQKRLKQEDFEDTVDERKNGSVPSTSSTSSTHAITAGRTKRKAKDKDKDKQVTVEAITTGDAVDSSQNPPPDAPEEEEQGITRCVCGSTGEDDPDAGEFMVQCETCKVWQHGLCMGFESEDQLHDDDYYCEECKPELHTDLFKRSRKRSKRPRQSSANSHHNPASALSRVSRSHSPSTLMKQPSKRRNTMNSRDAAFDESLKEIIEATAAEAAAAHDNVSVTSGGLRDGQQILDEEMDQGPGSRKKRKRIEDDPVVKKRTRSASTVSDHQGSTVVRDNTPVQNKGSTPAAPPSKPVRSNKRGGRKAVPPTLAVDTLASVDGEEVPLSTTKRQGASSRAKNYAPKRPPASHTNSHGGGTHELSGRRAQTNGVTGQAAGSSANESSRAYRNSHAYVVSQQPLYTSWNLPDYLAHLEPMLPTEAPQPLEVRGSATASGGGRGESMDRTMERGVKVKWPSKRMSVGDMNKRVRSLVEWVGREQATAQDRLRRRGALTKAFQEEQRNSRRSLGESGNTVNGSDGPTMMVERAETEAPVQRDEQFLDPTSAAKALPAALILQLDDAQSSATMKIMEELMEELIGFQEKFGPGARNRERERRLPELPHRSRSSSKSRSSSGSIHLYQTGRDDMPSTIRQSSPDFFDHISDSNAEEHEGDYSTRMEELFDDGEDEPVGYEEIEEDNSEEGFLYTGIDAQDVPTGYTDQLRDVLGTEFTDDELEAHEVERSLVLDENDTNLHSDDEEHFPVPVLSDHAPSTSSLGPIMPKPTGSPGPNGTFKLARPFLHPNVSRLRSFTPQSSRLASNGSGGSGLASNPYLPDGTSPSPSHFSSISRMSSLSNLNIDSSGDPKVGHTPNSDRDVFKWTELRTISEHIYNPLTQKLSSVLGAPILGTPTVLVANGLICVGTDQGKICVYDFKQTLKCICGNEASALTEIYTLAKTTGAVTALALSHDHTYVASGHATGHIQLFELKDPKTPARVVPPTTFAAVASGRKEGHIQGSRIVSIGFIAGRHTAIVSSDDHGLAFSHSLGKMFFVEAPDILRILGQYQPNSIAQVESPPVSGIPQSAPDTSLLQRRKSRYTILETMPLPLGTSPHATDQYNVIAMLTPTKLVVVGLKPTPRTWFKCPREANGGGSSWPKLKMRGTLAWFPSVLPLSSKFDVEQSPVDSSHGSGTPTTPMLVYTWGSVLHLIRVDESRTREMSRSTRTGKQVEIEVGRIFHEDVGRWSAEDDILAAQWLNANLITSRPVQQILVLTAEKLQVFDTHALKVIESVNFDGLSLVSPSLSSTVTGAASYPDSVGDVAHSLRLYKGKIFLLGRNGLRVGTLLTWADRILSFVQDGDFLSAIDLTRSYYVEEASGNRNGLPDNPVLRKEVIGGKIRELMVASARYAFSEDRMTDGTHVTSDGRGVDRTSLFEGLVMVCCRASVALGDFDFLFEELFQQYDESGISRIYLRQLEPAILNKDLRYVPPRITQRLVALHEEDNRPDLIERIIWHIDPACLDINQAIHLCQRYHIYDALIYVYTRALQDCVAPVVELLGLIRKVQQYRRSRTESTDSRDFDSVAEAAMEPITMNAYKIYPYLSNILSGLSYPSEEPLEEDEALRAKRDVYTFLFFGRSSVWPPGEGAKLVLTADEEGGVEPTYPYVRQLLRFDSESFLHSLDIAFEDPFLNDKSQGASRLLIVRILLEILASGDLASSDVTFVNIFIARNVPKYPQFLQVPPSALQGIIIGLAEDPDTDTCEDRQLAAEYLLSAYTPHESERIIHLFQSAGFYRILRSWHRHERRWGPLLSAYLDDRDLRPHEIFQNVDDVLAVNTRVNKGSISLEVLNTLSSAIPQLLDANLSSTADLLDRHTPELHDLALKSLLEDHQRFLYLRRLLGPSEQDEDGEQLPSLRTGPSLKLPGHLRQLYISLQCQYHPEDVIAALKYLPAELLDWNQVLVTCEAHKVYHAVVWGTNWRGDPQGALRKAEAYQKIIILEIMKALIDTDDTSPKKTDVRQHVDSLVLAGGIGVDICLEHSHRTSDHKAEVPLEDIWFQLLSGQINCVQTLSASRPELPATSPSSRDQDQILSTLRALVQRTFASLVSVASTQAVSFPRLFKRLVDSAPPSMHSQYTEFRTILTGMLESYRTEGDMLVITKHLVDRDLFETMAEIVRERERGWSPSPATSCPYCRKPVVSPQSSSYPSDVENPSVSKLVVSRTGRVVYHARCLPPEEP
ncbi:hypothetical protein D9615_002235 [Tricholomella constricta]|uniref:PHD-type domain-containing protein n=1 Tax=Tricholomella constricta TaxID=117010 RepID=A0A8H5MA81_9AGAR|nr:hypothetical protein D9615_002235 [Tricholomella constricta]